MKQLVVIAGLGLIGGSMAKAFKKHTDCLVYGWNRTRSVAERALADGAIDGIADNEVLARCDLLIPVLYPRATITFLERVIPTMKPGEDLPTAKAEMPCLRALGSVTGVARRVLAWG